MKDTLANGVVSYGNAAFLRKLLVATDGLDDGIAAENFAIALARRLGSKLEFCSAVDRADGLRPRRTLEGSWILDRARSRAVEAGVAATTTLLEGYPANAIVERESDETFDAVIVGTSHITSVERVFVGSVVDGVLRRSTVPVIVAPPGATDARIGQRSFLVAVDDSSPSDAAVAFAIDFAVAERATLVFGTISDSAEIVDRAEYYGTDLGATLAELHAAAIDLVERAARLAQARGIFCKTVVTSGRPIDQILHMAQSRGADAIVIGTHGRRGIRRLCLGSVAENVVRRSVLPVAVVRGR